MADNILFNPRPKYFWWVYDPQRPVFKSRDRQAVERYRNAILAERRRIAGRELTKEETKDGWAPPKPKPNGIVFDRRTDQWYWRHDPKSLRFFRREAAELWRANILAKRAEFMGRELLPDEFGKWDQKAAERRREQEQIDNDIQEIYRSIEDV
jgi:hypothetical protein